MSRRVILPENLMIIGPADSSHRFKNTDDHRVMEYVSHYDTLCDQGVKIISKEQLERFGASFIEDELNAMCCSHIYVSLDVDVSAFCGVLATRFTDLPGTEISLILKAVSAITNQISSNQFSLAGFDVMEVDIYKVGAKLKSAMSDRTKDLIQQYVSLFL